MDLFYHLSKWWLDEETKDTDMDNFSTSTETSMLLEESDFLGLGFWTVLEMGRVKCQLSLFSPPPPPPSLLPPLPLDHCEHD